MAEAPIQIFVSYSRQDQEYLEKGSLLGYLRGLERGAGASFWIDTRRLGAGDAWDAKIRDEIRRSRVALLLVSQTFLDSDYCHNVELPGIFEQKRRGLVVVPIILSACDWLNHDWIPTCQVLPGGNKNIESHYRERGARKELFLKIRTDLQAIVERQRVKAPQATNQPAARRLVTFLQSELVAAPGSPPLELDEQAETHAAFRRLVASTVGEAGQPIEREGNALVCYFGYPQARGNDARQAVRAALEISDRVAVERWWPGRDRRLAARIGLHTGWMAVTAEGPLGSPLDKVWDVRHRAAADAVVASHATFQRVRGFFTCEVIAGAGDERLYRVRQPGGGDHRFDLAASEAATPMVGRKEALTTILEAWDQLRHGHGGAVLISGESGLGKSRLVRRLTEDFAAEDYTWLIGRGARDFRHSAFRPVHDFLQDIFHFSAADPAAEKLAKLEVGFDKYGLSRHDDLPLLCRLLSVPLPSTYPRLGAAPSRQMERTREILRTLVRRLAEERPLVLVLEDLDWVDSSTRRLLEQVLSRGPTSRTLVLLTCTPAFLGSWTVPEHVRRIDLGRLEDGEVLEMILDLPEDEALPKHFQRRVVERARGVPLFVEELARWVHESGAAEAEAREAEAAPATLEDTLTARFELLPPASQKVVRLAAVLGRQWSFAMLAKVSLLDAKQLQTQLDGLVAKGFLYQGGRPPRSTYMFKHPMIRATAYGWSPASTRRRHHRRIAEVLAADPAVRESQPETLAHHFAQAGRLEKAVTYHLRAGAGAWAHLATEEAVSHLESGLELIHHEDYPDTDTQGLELDLLTTLGHVQIATEGHASPNVEKTFLRSRKLVRPELFEVSWGLATCYLVRAEFSQAYDIARELIRLAKMMQDPRLEMEAHTTAGQIRSGQGENADARRHLEKALELAAAHRDAPVRLTTPQDAEATALGFLGVISWLQGSTDEALDLCRRSLERAESLDQPFNVAVALNFSGFVLQFLGRARELLDVASRIVDVSTENGFLQWLATGQAMRGWARIAASDDLPPTAATEILEGVRQALQAYRRSGARLAQGFAYSMLIDAWLRRGEPTQARAVLDEAFEYSRDIEDRFWHAELHRLAGEVRLASAPQRGAKAQARKAAAEKDFQQAMDLARQQGAVALELRAAESLASLWRRQRKKKRAEELLEEIRQRLP